MILYEIQLVDEDVTIVDTIEGVRSWLECYGALGVRLNASTKEWVRVDVPAISGPVYVRRALSPTHVADNLRA